MWLSLQKVKMLVRRVSGPMYVLLKVRWDIPAVQRRIWLLRRWSQASTCSICAAKTVIKMKGNSISRLVMMLLWLVLLLKVQTRMPIQKSLLCLQARRCRSPARVLVLRVLTTSILSRQVRLPSPPKLERKAGLRSTPTRHLTSRVLRVWRPIPPNWKVRP